MVIVGGGTSGCACAYMCAKNNLKTLLVEKNNYLGGLMTGGLVVPVMKSAVSDLNCEYYKKLVECAKKYNAQITYFDGNDGWFNPEIMKIVLEDLLSQNEIKKNLDILFETQIQEVEKDDFIIKKVILNSRTLSIPIGAKYFVDSTSVGALSKLSGCKFLNDNEIKQQNSLRFILGNVDIEKFTRFIKSVDSDEDITNTYRNDINTRDELHFTTASTWDENKIWALDKYLQKGVEKGILKPTDRAYFQIFSVAGGFGQVAFNCPRVNNFNDNPYKASLELIEAKRAIWRLYKFVKSEFVGFENSIITNIAPITGVREYCRVKPKYIYTKDDLISGRTFSNPVLRANYSIDVHSDKKDGSILQKTSAYELPIESLISNDIHNLFISGMLVGADFMAHSALRVQKSCMSMGEGIANYIAEQEKQFNS